MPNTTPDLEIIPPNHGSSFDIAGVHLRWKARGEQTDYSFSINEQRLHEGEGVPLHHHPYAEVFYVLDGPVTFLSGDYANTSTTVCETGATVVIPANAVHGFNNETDKERRLLGISTYLHQRFFDEVEVAARRGDFDGLSVANAMNTIATIATLQKMHFLEVPARNENC